MFRVQDGEGAHALDVNQILDQLQGRGVIAGGSVTAAPGSHMIEVEATAVFLNGTRHEIPETTLDLENRIESKPRKVILYVSTAGALEVAEGEPADPQPRDEHRFNTYRPAPPDLSHMDAVPLAEIWLSPLDTRTTDADIRDRTVDANLQIHSASVNVLDVDTIVDGTGTSHSGELADYEDVPSDANIRDTINTDPDHATTASHNYFSGDHADLTNVTSDQHHAPPTPEEMRNAVRGVVDAAELDGASGAAGDHLEWTGSDVRWNPPPEQQAMVYSSGSVTHTGGSSTTVTIQGVAPDQTAQFAVVVGVNTAPSWSADYGFDVDVARQWDSTNSELDLELTLTWTTDPGSGNDLDVGYTIWDREPAIVDGRFTDADAINAIDGASISPDTVLVSSRIKYPVYDNLVDAPAAELGDIIVISGAGTDAFGEYIYDGAAWSGPLGTSVTSLSDLTINVAKDWSGYPITNVGAPVNPADAARVQELNDHAADASAHHAPVTGADIDHANITNVQPDQHHAPPTDQDIVERAAGRVFSLPLLGATIPSGEYLRDYLYLESDETLTLVRGEFYEVGGTVPAGLELQLYDQIDGTVEYRQTSTLQRGGALATINGRADVEARIYNGTGSAVSASGVVSYYL